MEPNDIIESLTKPLVPDIPDNVRKWIESDRKPMTNEEHIEQLKKLRSFHNGSYGRSINKAIETLEQELILDKIRAEIEALNPVDYVSMSSYEGHRGASDMKRDVLWIIDKYIEESEEV